MQLTSQTIIVLSLCLHAYAALSGEENPFIEYEKCIRHKVKVIQLNRGKAIPQAIISQLGDDVKVNCNACKRPGTSWEDMEIKWYRRLPNAAKAEEVKTGRQNYRLGEEKQLLIDHVKKQHAGQYFCIYRNQIDALYYLEVVKAEPRKLVAVQGKLPRPAEPVKLEDNNIKMMTIWSEWSKCSTCNGVGLRRKLGTCYVKKIMGGVNTSPENIAALELVVSGLPCRSSSIYPLEKHIEEIRKRQSEVLVDYCYTNCPTSAPIRNVTDKYGNLIDQVEGEGSYSVHEPKPPLPPTVHRETHYVQPGTAINFTCPRGKLRTRESKTNIRWENGSVPMNPVSLRRETRGRVYIDHSERLTFQLVRKSDIGYYSCWQQEWLVAVFRIEREPINVVKWLPDIFYFAAIILTIVCAFALTIQMCRTSQDKRYK